MASTSLQLPGTSLAGLLLFVVSGVVAAGTAIVSLPPATECGSDLASCLPG